MIEAAKLKCDSCGTSYSKDELPAVPRPGGAVNPRDFILYRVSIRPVTRPIEAALGGAYFDLCANCVLKRTHGLGREEGDNLPPVPEPAGFEQQRICTCGATEYLEGSFAEFCSNGHAMNPEYYGFGHMYGDAAGRTSSLHPNISNKPKTKPLRQRLVDRVKDRISKWTFPGV